MARQSPVYGVNAIIMFNRTDKHMYSYKPSTKEWSRMQEYSLSNSFFTTVVSGKHIYTIHHRSVRQLEYSDSTAKWKQMSSMIEDHDEAPPSAVLNGSIYVCGGSHIYGTSQFVKRYDADSDRWDRLCAMNIARRNPCAVATNDNVYSIGGEDEEAKCLKSVECFDEKFNKLKFVPSLPRPIHRSASAAVVKNRIYVADHDGVLYFDLQYGIWMELSHTNHWPFHVNSTPKILAVNEELYIIGKCVKKKIFSQKTVHLRIYLLEVKRNRNLLNVFEPETGQMTLVKEIDDTFAYNVRASAAVEL